MLKHILYSISFVLVYVAVKCFGIRISWVMQWFRSDLKFSHRKHVQLYLDKQVKWNYLLVKVRKKWKKTLLIMKLIEWKK